jgi:hypothetical protein
MKKNILLVGKYPPLQGGVAAKTYWLYQQLKTKGYKTQVVTAEVKNYTIREIPKDNSVHLVTCKEIPWHIPDSNLLYDRLLQKSLEVVKDFPPDIIETNYLWPFCSVAASLSDLLKKPLLIRHAGSDILKFSSDPEFKTIIRSYVNQANKIVTNNTSYSYINELCDDKSKVELLPRYIPDPIVFKEVNKAKKYDILFAGKINYFWNLKGIAILVRMIREKDLKALFIIDGNYLGDVIKMVETENLRNSIEIINFVHPKEMPKFINQCKSVWCWESGDAIEDFSNIIWEACFCNVKCVLNPDRKRSEELDLLVKAFPELIEWYKKEKTPETAKQEKSKHKPHDPITVFHNYIDLNLRLYDSLLDH